MEFYSHFSKGSNWILGLGPSVNFGVRWFWRSVEYYLFWFNFRVLVTFFLTVFSDDLALNQFIDDCYLFLRIVNQYFFSFFNLLLSYYLFVWKLGIQVPVVHHQWPAVESWHFVIEGNIQVVVLIFINFLNRLQLSVLWFNLLIKS